MHKSILFPITVAVLFLSSCVTVNRLDEFSFEGSSMISELFAPEFAEVNLNRGSIPGSHENALLGLIETGVNVAVGIEENRIEQRLNEVLTGDDLTIALESEFVPQTAELLEMFTTDSLRDADYLLELVVDEYGLDGYGELTLDISIDARIVHLRSGELVWRRRLSVNQPVSGSYFNLPGIAQTALSLNAIDQISDRDLREGFDALSRDAARELALMFRRDYFDSRSF